MHTIRVFYDMFENAFPAPTQTTLEQRQLIHALDTAALQRPRRIFAIGNEVSNRLREYNGLEAAVLRHPTSLKGLHAGAFNYFFLPGRLHRWKRTDLAIAAMRHVKGNVELVISGTGEDEERVRRLAESDSRIRFVGRVSDDALTELYANALAVLFTPEREDLGLVTLEAFQSGKPVITCGDSGEPARLVEDGRNGYVCAPDPAYLGAILQKLVDRPERAAAMGHAGQASVADITWPKVAATLREALGFRETADSE